MTTAARPTYDPARGGTGRSESDLGALSKQYSSRDLPGHTKLKYRQDGQNSVNDVKNRDFRRELEEKERINQEKKDRSRGSGSSSSTKRPRIEQLPASNIDADDPVDEDEDDEDDSDEDDTAALQAELEKIKRERATETARKEAERKVMEEKIRMENILKGNPLLNQEKSDFKVKRRWDDDVVFKNCASGEDKRKDKGFINDSLRSEFHKKFMEKYIN